MALDKPLVKIAPVVQIAWPLALVLGSKLILVHAAHDILFNNDLTQFMRILSGVTKIQPAKERFCQQICGSLPFLLADTKTFSFIKYNVVTSWQIMKTKKPFPSHTLSNLSSVVS